MILGQISVLSGKPYASLPAIKNHILDVPDASVEGIELRFEDVLNRGGQIRVLSGKPTSASLPKGPLSRNS